MKRIILVALAAALLFVGAPAPTEATPTNTIFDRTVNGCTYQFKFGNTPLPFAQTRSVNNSSTYWDCRVSRQEVAYGSPSGTSANNGPLTGWNDTAWHAATNNVGTAYAGKFEIIQFNKATGCGDFWHLTASVFDDVMEGAWSYHNFACPG